MGVNERHDCDSAFKTKAIGVATVPEGRLTYIEPDNSAEGQMLTWPLVLADDGGPIGLTIEAEVGANGLLQVEVLDANNLRHLNQLEPFTFKGPLETGEMDCGLYYTGVKPQPIRLRFTMRGEVKLFNFKFK